MFERFMETIQPDPEIREQMQQWIGHALIERIGGEAAALQRLASLDEHGRQIAETRGSSG